MKQIRKRLIALTLFAAMSFGALQLPDAALTKSFAAGASAQTLLQQSPSEMTVRDGEKVTVSVEQTEETGAYQWYYKKAGAAQWSIWKGHTTASTSANANSTWNGMQLYCKITDASGKETSSDPITIRIEGLDQLSVTAQPQDIATEANKTVSFSVKATGTGLTYQWYYKKEGAAAWSLWKGHTTPTTKAVSNESWNGMQVYCLVKDSLGNKATSRAAKITIVYRPWIIMQTESLDVYNGGRATFKVEAGGTGLKYQWYYKKKDASDWKKWNGRTEAIVTAIANSTWDGMQAKCEVTGVTGHTVTSQPCVFTVVGDASLNFLSQSQNVTVNVGDKVTFWVETLGGNVHYQWYYRKVGTTEWKAWNGHTTAKTSAVSNATWDGMQVYCMMWQNSGYKPKSDPVTVTIISEPKTAKTVGVDAKTHTQSKIEEYIKGLNIDPKSGKVTYDENPIMWPGPNGDKYNIGKVSQNSLNNALNTLNAIRYIAGVPNTVKLDDTYTQWCQAGALVNAANGWLSDSPEQPSKMKKEIYSLGKKGCAGSNQAWTRWNAGFYYMLVNMWLDDSDMLNYDWSMENRRWLLNPVMGKTGFGHVQSNGAYGMMYAKDKSGSSDVKTVVWPAQQTPLEYFPADSAWTISSTNFVANDDIRVRLERVRDGEVKTYQMNIGSGNSDDGFIKYNSKSYGTGSCIVFRPDDCDYKAGDIYNVYLYENNKLTKSYAVKFFSLG